MTEFEPLSGSQDYEAFFGDDLQIGQAEDMQADWEEEDYDQHETRR